MCTKLDATTRACALTHTYSNADTHTHRNTDHIDLFNTSPQPPIGVQLISYRFTIGGEREQQCMQQQRATRSRSSKESARRWRIGSLPTPRDGATQAPPHGPSLGPGRRLQLVLGWDRPQSSSDTGSWTDTCTRFQTGTGPGVSDVIVPTGTRTVLGMVVRHRLL